MASAVRVIMHIEDSLDHTPHSMCAPISDKLRQRQRHAGGVGIRIPRFAQISRIKTSTLHNMCSSG